MARPGFESVVLVTGFPSLYVCKMIERVLSAEPAAYLYFTVDSARAAEAHAFMAGMIAANRDRMTLLEGSSTAIDFGLSGAEFRMLTREVDVIHHMAHTDDNAASLRDAELLNVQSAAEVLEIARASRSLRSLVFHSTAAVSGERHGLVLESELDEGQTFKSPALSTRMRAERMIRKAMKDVPICVVRPSAIVGGAIHANARPSARDRRVSAEHGLGEADLDWSEGSDAGAAAEEAAPEKTGDAQAQAPPEEQSSRNSAGVVWAKRSFLPPRESEQLEGVHLLILLLIAAPRELAIPLPRAGAEMPLHVVPIDFAVRAAHALGQKPSAVGKTFHISDPHAPTVRQVIDTVQAKLKNRTDRGYIPSDLARILLRTPGIERFVRNPRVFMERLFLPVRYDMSNAIEVLQGTGVECPPFDAYADDLIRAVEEHIRLQRDRHSARTRAQSEAEVDDPLL